MLLIMMLCGQAVMAENYTFEEGENTLVLNVSVNGTYTVKQTGKIIIETMDQGFTITCGGVTVTPKTVYTDGGYNTRYDLQAQAGDVISITSSFCMNNKLRITELGEGQIQIKPVSITPAASTTFSWNTSGMVTVQFNTPITASSATVVYSGKSYSVDEFRVSNQFVSFNITNAINEAYSNGLTEGKPLQIRITGITDLYDNTNKYGGTGNYIFAYKAPHQQGTMTSAVVNGQNLQLGMNTYTFQSFYATDSEDGIFTFEFSKPVQSIQNTTLTMGNLDQSTIGKYYYEELNDVVKIEGNKVTIDVRGKLRSLARMFPSVDMSQEVTDPEERGYVDYENISLAISNVIDENGNSMYSSAQGSVGSFSYTFRYNEIEDNIAMDGDGISEGDAVVCDQTIRLWVDQKVKSVNGIKVSYKVPQSVIEEETAAKGYALLDEPIDGEDLPDYATVTVDLDMSSVSIEDDPDGCIVVFKIPSEMPNAVEEEQVRVVVDVTTTNGMPHDLVINFFYNAVPTAIDAITTAKPAAVNAAYNLAGQRVNDNAKGIIIMNGKKVLK